MNILQNDLDTISSWAENWLMELNINKCSVLSITLKRIFIFHDNSILGATLRKGVGWAIPSALAQCELEGFGWTWSSSGVSDCAFPISLNVFGIVAVVLDSLKPRHHGKVPYPRRLGELLTMIILV